MNNGIKRIISLNIQHSETVSLKSLGIEAIYRFLVSAYATVQLNKEKKLQSNKKRVILNKMKKKITYKISFLV